MVSQDEWMQATATKTLDMSEMDELVRQSIEAWEDYDVKRKAAAEANTKAEAIDRKIAEALKAAGKTKYFVDGLGTVSITQTPVVRVPGSIEAKKIFFKYLRSISEEVLYALATVNSNSLNSWYKAKMEEAEHAGNLLGFSVPGIEQPTMRESLRFLKDRKAKT